MGLVVVDLHGILRIRVFGPFKKLPTSTWLVNLEQAVMIAGPVFAA